MAGEIEIPEGNVTLMIEGDEEKFVVNRRELAKRSRYFHCLFKGDFKEANAEIVTLKGEDELMAVKFLMASYGTNRDEMVTDSSLLNLLRAADYLQINETGLFELYGRVKLRSPRTILANFDIIHRMFKQRIEWEKYNLIARKNDRVKFSEPVHLIGPNLKTLIYEREWSNLEPEHVKTLLSWGRHNHVDLDILVPAIKTWLNHDEERKELLPELLACIKGCYTHTEMETVVEMILNFDPKSIECKDMAIGILLEKLELKTLQSRLPK